MAGASLSMTNFRRGWLCKGSQEFRAIFGGRTAALGHKGDSIGDAVEKQVLRFAQDDKFIMGRQR